MESLVNHAKKLGIKSLALTDHNSTAGHGEFEELCIKAGIRPVFGVELDLAFGFDKSVTSVVFIARDSQGYGNLLRLASMPKPVSWDVLTGFREGLVLLEGGSKGKITCLLREGKIEDALRVHARYTEEFGQNYYLRHEIGQREKFWDTFPEQKIILCQDIRHIDLNTNQALELLAKIGGIEAKVPEHPFLSWEEMASQFVGPQSILKNTLELAESCRVKLAREDILPPHPDGESLEKLVWEGAEQRFGKIDLTVKERLENELSIINDLNFSDYFLIVADLVRFAKRAQIPVGPGRGSAASSLVAYCLGITEINPLHWGLLFERFLNKARQNRPDIDLDFCYERRNEIIAYAVERFGPEHVAQIGTYGTFGARSSQQEVVRHLGTDNPTIAEQILGLKRHQSTHAAGIVITGQPIQDISAIYPHRDFPVTHLDMYSLENLGVLKIDVLGLRTLTFLNNIVGEIKKREPHFSPADIPLEDEATFELLSQGKTLGIFQLESDLFRKLLRSMQPNSFNDLVALLALGRPGPLSIFPEYLKRREGAGEINYPHPGLEEILGETHGLILYQEQVMLIAHYFGGLSLGEADLLRLALGKKDHQAIQRWEQRFIEGSTGKSLISSGDAKRIFKMITKFSGYAFNKAHSVSYALISWRAAYLKARYPAEFYVTLLRDGITGDELTHHLLDCQSLGVKVLQPSILYSKAQATLEADGIRLGLCTNRQITPQDADLIVQTRKRRRIDSWNDFRQRIRLDAKSLEKLVLSGACDDLGDRYKLARSINLPITGGLELLDAERELLGIYASRHPATLFEPLLRNLQGDLDVVVGKILDIGGNDTQIPGVLESPQGVVMFQTRGGKARQDLQKGRFVALFGTCDKGLWQVKWFLKLGPILLISPKQDELQIIKTILQEEQGPHPVVLRICEGIAYHLLPQQFWVKNVEKIEKELRKSQLVYVWFDPWKENVS